ncbi:MAG TPA: adenylosuccinate lyase family protein [Bryobacteraceae bacterium]|nr:adenylosuccinate lyase family protein [Bryobacteraceae bacterium]
MTSSRLIGSLATTPELAEIFSDGAVIAAFLRFESTLARAQARIGLIPESAAQAIARIQADELDAVEIARDARTHASIAIPLVRALTARVESIDEPAARFVHWGATSQDAIDTTMSLLLVAARPLLARDHARLEQSLRDLSGKHASTVMLARTLLQPAPPITFGYKAAVWYAAIHRSWTRLCGAFDQAAVLQFGGASGTLASYRDRGSALAIELAKELELPYAGAPWHTDRGRIAELVADCGIYTAGLGKIARDVSLLMQPEVGELAEPGGGSSAMPNKRNPSGSVIALAAAARMPGTVAAFLTAMVQEHERSAGGWQSEWPTVADAVETTGSALAAMAASIEGLSIFPDRMRANLDATRGTIFAEKARMLVQAKIGRDRAHRLLAEAAASGLPFGEALWQQPEIAALLSPEQIAAIDAPEDYLGAAEEFRRKLLED